MYIQNCLQKYKCEGSIPYFVRIVSWRKNLTTEHNLQGQLGMDTEEQVYSFKETSNTPKCTMIKLIYSNDLPISPTDVLIKCVPTLNS